MPIRLEITFTGLFLFVPEPTTDTLHVVLPTTGFGPVHPHTATIGAAGAGEEFGGEDIALVGTGSGKSLDPPAESVQLKSITGKGLGFDQIRRPGRRPNIHARIRLPRASSMMPGEMSARFDVPGLGVRPMSHRVEWTLADLDQAKAVFNRSSYDGSNKPAFEFIPSDGVVRLCIHHLPSPEHEHEENPGPGSEAEHFQAYYRVYVPPFPGGNPRQVDEYTSEPSHPCFPQKAASTFTCMTAQVVPE